MPQRTPQPSVRWSRAAKQGAHGAAAGGAAAAAGGAEGAGGREGRRRSSCTCRREGWPVGGTGRHGVERMASQRYHILVEVGCREYAGAWLAAAAAAGSERHLRIWSPTEAGGPGASSGRGGERGPCASVVVSVG